MKPVLIWGPALALGVVGCVVYFVALRGGVGGKVGAAAGDGRVPSRAQAQVPPTAAGAAEGAKGAASGPLVYTYKIQAMYPHDPAAFTQGLLYYGKDSTGKNDILYESTGLYQQSTVRQVVLQTGKVLQLVKNGPEVFGEGLATVAGGTKLMQLMWKTNSANLFRLSDLKPLGQVQHGMADGWGLTGAGNGSLYGSDGTADLYLLSGKDYSTIRKVRVKDGDQEIFYLNELERIGNHVFANVWQTPCIARIDPATGKVLGWLLFDTLVAAARASAAPGRPVDVLNGIAWDAARQRLFVTGKLWPSIYEVKIVKARDQAKLLGSARKKCWPSPGFL